MTQPKPCGHMRGSVVAERQGTQLADTFGLVAVLSVRTVLRAAQMGKGELAEVQFLAGFHREASYRIHSQPSGNKAHLLYLEFPEMKWNGGTDWLHFQLMLLITMVVGSFCQGGALQKAKELLPMPGAQLNANAGHLEQGSPALSSGVP